MGLSLPLDLKDSIDRLTEGSLASIGCHRTEVLRKWVARAYELTESEEERSSRPLCLTIAGRQMNYAVPRVA